MNIFKNTTSTINTPGTLFYSSVNGASGIDLRSELHKILYGDSLTIPLGHYVVLRHFTTEHSEYYNPITKEGVGGSAYKYIDSIIKTRRVPIRKPRQDETKIGVINLDVLIYYFEHNVDIKEPDQILEFEWADHRILPKLSQITTSSITDRFTVNKVHKYRLEYGRIEYLMVSTNNDDIRY